MNIEEIFKHNIRTLYNAAGTDEMNEVILLLYNLILLALRQEADSLVLTDSEIFWERAGKVLGQYPVTAKPDRGYDGELDFMLRRDAILNDYVKKAASSAAAPVRYKLSVPKTNVPEHSE